jgi:hypothetical protein
VNYFAHALPFLDDPYFAVGTGVPDWLSVVDRRVRMRMKYVEPFTVDPDPTIAAVAGGVRQHLADDAHFHGTRAFAETNIELIVLMRDVLDGETGLRPGFLGHLLAEVLLDAALVAEHPDELQQYYRLLESTDATVVEAAVNRMAPRPTERLATMIVMFTRERILSDYLEDAKLLRRLNQVMRRIRLEPLPDRFAEILPAAREVVARRREELLEGIPA